MNKNIFQFVLSIGVLLLVSLACGGSNEGTVITPQSQAIEQEAPSAEEPEAATVENEIKEEQQPAFEIYEVGDLIEIKEHTIRLNSIEYQGSILVANFTVENHGSSDLAVSSMLSFSAKKEDGTLLEQEYFDCGTSGLDGSILPGDKLRGDVCWSGVSPDSGIKVYYEASLFGQGAVVWNATQGVAEEIASGAETPPQVEVFHVGDLVQVKSHTIRLNNLEYQGAVLIADFTVENQGDSNISLSSMISFSAKKGDGTLLEQEYFDCGTSSLDGKVLPGDRYRGSVCWAGAIVEDGIKIYYEAEMFGEGAVVWEGMAGNSEPVDISDAQLKVNVYQFGEIVQIKDQTIILNSVEFLGNVLKANFTLENLSSTDLNVSSMLSFYARKRDGLSLEQEYFDCGTSFDGSIIPGDKLRGDICWVGANPGDGIKIYYEAELFGEGAAVWMAE